MLQFDLVVVGTGAGLSVSAAAAGAGKRVAVIDRGPFGGSCLNRACIPSKMLIHSADVLEVLRGAHRFGIDAEVRGIDWDAMVRRVTKSIDADATNLEAGNRAHPNITVFNDDAAFIGDRTLTVGGATLHGDAVVIAAGSRPRVPDVPGLAESTYLTSDDALRLPVQPRTLVILGGGATAVELAHLFGTLGTEITIVQRGRWLLSNHDETISRRLTEVYARRSRVLTGHTTRSVRQDGNQVLVDVEGPDGRETISAEALLVALGRVPNSDTLAVQAGGVGVDGRGFVQTNEYLETRAPGVWALGDIVGKYFLRHSANLEASYVAHNLLHPDSKQAVDYMAMPHAIFGSPQVARVGMTEREARERGRPYLIGEYPYSRTAYGTSIEDHDGFVKAIADADTHEILGCHIMGSEATVLIQEVALLMRLHAPVDAITGAIYAHPALPEVVQAAFGSLAEPDGHDAPRPPG